MMNGRRWPITLGQGLHNLATIYLPDVIVLGGGVAVGAGTKLLDAARQVMAQRLKLVPVPRVRLVTWATTQHCGVLSRWR